MSDPLAHVLEKFPTAKPNGSGWMARCPVHDDQRASLSISTGDDGRVLLHCHAGCAFAAILDAVQLTPGDLFPSNGDGTRIRDHADDEITYDYVDEAGALLFQVVRRPPKRFAQRRPDGTGGFIWKIDGVRRVLYGLNLLAGHEAVLVVEGEKDVETLRRHGFTATTNPHGAGRWRDEYAQQLRAAGCQRVAILPDNDAPGTTHARQVAQSCHKAGLFVKIVPLAGLPKKGDVSDYLRAHSRDDLRAAIHVAPPFNPGRLVSELPQFALTSLRDLLAEPDTDTRWLVEDRIALGSINVLVAPPKTGKTTLARAVAFSVATGTEFLGSRTRQGTVWYLALEEHRADVTRAFRKLGATGDEPIHVFAQQAYDTLLADLHARAQTERPALIIVDTLQRLIRTKDINDYAAVTKAFEPLLALARETGAALLLLHHASTHAMRDGLNAVLGSTAISGSADNVFVLKREGKRRVFSSDQRVGSSLDPVVVALDAAGWPSLAGTYALVTAAETADALADVIRQQPGLTEREIQEHVECRRNDACRALRTLLHQGRVTREGEGKRGTPYRYRWADSGSHGSADSGSRVIPFGNHNREPEKAVENKGLKFDFSFVVPDPIYVQPELETVRSGDQIPSPSTYVSTEPPEAVPDPEPLKLTSMAEFLNEPDEEPDGDERF